MKRPFSYWSLQWTDTGERPWYWCLILMVMWFVYGLTAFYRDDVMGACVGLIFCGVNFGYIGKERATWSER